METSCFFDLKNGTCKQNYYVIIRKTLIDKQLLRPEVKYSNQMTCLVIIEAFFPLIYLRRNINDIRSVISLIQVITNCTKLFGPVSCCNWRYVVFSGEDHSIFTNHSITNYNQLIRWANRSVQASNE